VVDEGVDERVAAEVAKGGLDGAVQKRTECGDKVDEGHPYAAGRNSRNISAAQSWTPAEG
jgi:hypothetical protein